MTKYHKLVHLNDRYLFLTVLEPGKPKNKVPADLVLGEGSYSSLQMATLFSLCPHRRERQKK